MSEDTREAALTRLHSRFPNLNPNMLTKRFDEWVKLLGDAPWQTVTDIVIEEVLEMAH